VEFFMAFPSTKQRAARLCGERIRTGPEPLYLI
jgi:hypothetical protein